MLINYLKKIKNYLVNFVINKIYIKTNPSTYYEATLSGNKRRFLGSFNFFRILVLNILFPGRLFFKFKYSILIRLHSSIQKDFNKNLKIFIDNYQNFFDNDKINILKNSLETLSKDGAVLIDSYFSDNLIEKIKFQYRDIISQEKLIISKDLVNSPDSTAKYNWHICKFDKELKLFWYDPGIILLLESYFGRALYARNYPFLLNTFVPKSYHAEDSYSKTADIYHVDHCLLATIYIFLEDVQEDGTCLEIIQGSHKYFHTAWPFSKESTLKMKKKRMTGKKGSIHIHLGNTVHKAHLESGKSRLSFMFEYTLGGNILFNVKKLTQSYSNNFDIDQLGAKERNFFHGIYPKSLPKGYEINGQDGLMPNSFKDQ